MRGDHIISKNWKGEECTLRHEKAPHAAAMEGYEYTDFRGGSAIITGGKAPHKPGSQGKVWTRDGGEYFPSVFGLVWMRNSDLS
jgi:hypothetical protein